MTATTDISIGATIEQTGVTLSETYERGIIAEQVGCDALYMIQMPNQRDTLTVLGGMAAQTKNVELVSSILPFFTRPPMIMAQNALTLDEVSGGRLILGVGLGNPMVGQFMLGTEQGPPLQVTREYLTITTSLIRDGEASYTGRWYSANGTYAGPRRASLPVWLGTFGPKMVQLAGELADGLLIWMVPPSYIRDVIVPNLRIGMERRERAPAEFPITMMLSISVTDSAFELERFRRAIAGYSRVPAYRRLFEAAGFGADLAAGRPTDRMVEELTAFGTEERLHERMADYVDAGVTRFAVSPYLGREFDPERLARNLRAALAFAAKD